MTKYVYNGNISMYFQWMPKCECNLKKTPNGHQHFLFQTESIEILHILIQINWFSSKEANERTIVSQEQHNTYAMLTICFCVILSIVCSEHKNINTLRHTCAQVNKLIICIVWHWKVFEAHAHMVPSVFAFFFFQITTEREIK